MSFKQLSFDNVNRLNNKIKELKSLKKELESKTEKELWLENLNSLY